MKFLQNKILKIVFTILAWLIGIPISILLLIGLFGLMGDFIARPQLRVMRWEAFEHFEEFKERGGYQKPAYFGDPQKGNALDFYSRAVVEVEKMSNEDKSTISSFFEHPNKYDQASVSSIVSRNDSILEFARRGLEQTQYLPPLDFDYDWERNIPIPNYMAFRTIAKLLITHGYFEQKKGRSQKAARDYLNALRIGQDCAGGDQMLLSNMIGLVCIGIASVAIVRDLETFSFDKKTLEEISRSLHVLSSTWPSLKEPAMNENRRTAISAGKMPMHEILIIDPIIEFDEGKDVYHFKKRNRFYLWWLTHLRSWSTFFSLNQAWVNYIKLSQEYAAEIGRSENLTFQELKLLEEGWDKRIKENLNWMVRRSFPNYTSMMIRQMEAMLKIRLMGTAALAQLYYLETHHYPSDLNDLDVGRMEYFLEDPTSSNAWNYRVFAEGDSCEISTPYATSLFKITLVPPKK
jgi:hypothetical protein